MRGEDAGDKGCFLRGEGGVDNLACGVHGCEGDGGDEDGLEGGAGWVVSMAFEGESEGDLRSTWGTEEVFVDLSYESVCLCKLWDALGLSFQNIKVCCSGPGDQG